MAYVELVREEMRRLQSELIQLRVQYDANIIDASAYLEKEKEILQSIRRITSPANR